MGVSRCVCVVASLALSGGCQLRPVVPPLAATLGPSWTMVPLPNTALVPGAVVQVVQAAPGTPAAGQLDLRLLGRLRDCAVPASAVVVQNAAVPSVVSGATYALDATLGAKLAGVSGQLGGNISSTVNFTIGASTDSTLDYIAFQRWATDPAHAAALSRVCGPILAQTGVFVVQEAFIISGGSYTFQTKAGVTIGVTPPPNVPVKATADASSGVNGALTITQPTVFALKVLQPLLQGGFQIASGLGVGAGVSTPGEVSAPHLAAVAPSPAASASPLLLVGHAIGSIEGLPGQ